MRGCPRRGWRHRPRVALLLALTGCAATPAPPDTAQEACDGPPELRIGTGDPDWHPLEEGAPLVMVHGPQGGWHVELGAWALNTGLVVAIDIGVEHLATGAPVAGGLWRVQLTPDGGCGGRFPGLFAFLDVSALADGDRDTPPELLAGEALRIRMSVTDDEGLVATGARQVVAVPDPYDL